MHEESKESKAKKLAAARKKLKEYQQRGATGGSNTVSNAYTDSSTNSGHVSSNISERSESELQLNSSINDITHVESGQEIETVTTFREDILQTENVNYFTMDQPVQTESTQTKTTSKANPTMFPEETFSDDKQNINAIQVLITEKAQLTTELNKFRTLCREKDLEMEELRVQHSNATKRVDDLSQRLMDIQKQQEQKVLHNAELQHKMAQTRAQQEEHSNHINELQQQLTLRDEQLKRLECDYREKTNELELSQLRIRQLSDENNISKDDRVETLTQTQFMYEQQIRDLQAMVQQLTQDKEQANTQYQTYVQQLNAQIQQLTDHNSELTEESSKLQEREKQRIDHIQQLEKEIQNNISRQAQVKEEKQKETATEVQIEQLQSLQDRVNEFDTERYEFQLKIKSQEDRLNNLQYELKQKQLELEQLKEHLENVALEQPDKGKLLATMESDKVAASRALSQNVELKKQLDELELRFVQLTNDKADLMNRLDSEQYANREMHANYAVMEERLKTIDERFRFKDEEMIRLSHENEELKKELQAYLNNNEHEHDHDNGHNHDNHDEQHSNNSEHYHDHNNEHHHHHDHDHDHEHQHSHDKDCHHEHIQDESDLHNHIPNKSIDHEADHECENHPHQHFKHEEKLEDHETCQEATEDNISYSSENYTPVTHKTRPASCSQRKSSSAMSHIATEEAVEKLQQRFTQLMTQCADLTEEKQRLEHLVMQLQSETETIGEYIALYQTQRRILKQREYERAAQTALLHNEREQMHERLTLLNNLVNSLGMQVPQDQQINETLLKNVSIEANSQKQETAELEPQQFNSPILKQTPNHGTAEGNSTHQNQFKSSTTNLSSPESQQILHKIQDIITEIKENTKELSSMPHTVDHLNCCSGKFEVV